MNQKTEIREFIQVLKKKLWLIISITLAFMFLAGIKIFFFTTPVYEAQTTIMMNNLAGRESKVTEGDIKYSQLIGDTYRPILQSRRVALEIKKNLNLKMEYQSISKSIAINSVSGPVMNITVKNSDPKIAQKIANEVPEVFGTELEKMAGANIVEVIDEALLPNAPINNNKTKGLILGLIVGLAISIFVVLLLDYFDDKVKTPEELEELLKVSLLGGIIKESNKEKEKRNGEISIIADPKCQISEAFRNIRTNIQFSNLDKNLSVISVTSSLQNEGKSTIVSNLGATFGNLDNKNILIMDCDLRNPSIHRLFGISNSKGLTDVLLENKTFNQCVQSTKIKNLKVLTTGNIPQNPAEILNSKRMKDFVEGMKEEFDYIFIDTPPIGIVSDAGIISSYSDGVILLAASESVNSELVKMSKERLMKVNANIIGCILNKFDYKKYNVYSDYGYYYSGNRKERKSKKLIAK